jgi:hypothetical protein
MESGRSTTISVGFDPINFNTPSGPGFLTITIQVIGVCTVSVKKRRDSVNVGIDTRLGSSEVYIVINRSTKKIE